MTETLCKTDAGERKEGVWKKVQGMRLPIGGICGYIFECPFCHSQESEHINGIETRQHWHYCPVCGARLKYPWEMEGKSK